MSYAAQVMTSGSTRWDGNALRFATKEEAEAYAFDLMGRWFLVTDTRVVDSSDPVNYA